MRTFFKILATAAFLAGTFFLYFGFDKKNNYNNPEYSWQDSTNAYVGGDAYNYIINSNYFTGYNVLGIGSYILSVLGLLGDGILGRLDDHNKSAEQYYGYIYHHPMFKNFGEKNDRKPKNNKFSANDWGKLPDLKPDDPAGIKQNTDRPSENSMARNNTSQSSGGNFAYPPSNTSNNPQIIQQSPYYQRNQSMFPYGQKSPVNVSSQFPNSNTNINNAKQPNPDIQISNQGNNLNNESKAG